MTALQSVFNTQDAHPGTASKAFDFTSEDFRMIAKVLRDETGIFLNDSKTTLVYSRIAKRVRALGLNAFADYCALVRNDSAERQAMVEALTTNTTSFFREAHHFEQLQREILPPLVKAARGGKPVRIWSSASSSGQEPYSIALTLLKVEPEAARLDIKILATDVNTQMVAQGAAGAYSDEEIAGIGADMLQRHFTRTATERGHLYTASAEMKSLLRFRQLNLQGRWPMRRPFDVIFCRNVMIYFDQETQSALWARLVNELPGGGYLMIGHSERVTGEAAQHVETVGISAYRKRIGGLK